MFRIEPKNKNSIFIELTCFKSIFNVAPSFYIGFKPPLARKTFL